LGKLFIEINIVNILEHECGNMHICNNRITIKIAIAKVND